MCYVCMYVCMYVCIVCVYTCICIVCVCMYVIFRIVICLWCLTDHVLVSSLSLVICLHHTILGMYIELTLLHELTFDPQVSINALNNKGQTPLHYSAFSHHGALCMELLAKAGADPNIQDSDGRTALHMTAIHGFYLRTETLISHGEGGAAGAAAWWGEGLVPIPGNLLVSQN